MKTDPGHHKEDSPLLGLNLNFIVDFIMDPMNMIDGGAFKKFMEYVKDEDPAKCSLSGKELCFPNSLWVQGPTFLQSFQESRDV